MTHDQDAWRRADLDRGVADYFAAALADIPAVKVRHFAEEARALDAARMQALEPHKRATLTVALIAVQAARALDDLGEMFVRRMQHIHNAAKLALDRYRAATVEPTDGLITTLHELLLAHQDEGTPNARFKAIRCMAAKAPAGTVRPRRGSAAAANRTTS